MALMRDVDPSESATLGSAPCSSSHETFSVSPTRAANNNQASRGGMSHSSRSTRSRSISKSLPLADSDTYLDKALRLFWTAPPSIHAFTTPRRDLEQSLVVVHFFTLKGFVHNGIKHADMVSTDADADADLVPVQHIRLAQSSCCSYLRINTRNKSSPCQVGFLSNLLRLPQNYSSRYYLEDEGAKILERCPVPNAVTIVPLGYPRYLRSVRQLKVAQAPLPTLHDAYCSEMDSTTEYRANSRLVESFYGGQY